MNSQVNSQDVYKMRIRCVRHLGPRENWISRVEVRILAGQIPKKRLRNLIPAKDFRWGDRVSLTLIPCNGLGPYHHLCVIIGGQHGLRRRYKKSTGRFFILI